MEYWDFVEPLWDTLLTDDPPDSFLEKFLSSPEVSRNLFAMHWCDCEISNGGFFQFFSNSTGILAPEAIVALRTIGMPQTADVIQRAMRFFDAPYPRHWEQRRANLNNIRGQVNDFRAFDEQYFALVETEGGGIEKAANAYATACAQ